MKRFHYLGYIIEFSRIQKLWFVVDWDYEHESDIGPPHRTKSAAMAWCERNSI